jgi:hypothetical protein
MNKDGTDNPIQNQKLKPLKRRGTEDGRVVRGIKTEEAKSQKPKKHSGSSSRRIKIKKPGLTFIQAKNKQERDWKT